MVVIRALLSLVIVHLAVACSSSEFAGEAEKKGAEKVPATPSTGDVPPPPGTFGLGQIQDRQVNTGDRSHTYSEELHVDLKPQGGNAPYSIKIETTPHNPRIVLTDQRISFKPGYTDNSGYHSEEGSYNVTATVTDASGRSVSETFAIKVVPIQWSSAALKTASTDDMIVDFTINEKLHPNRTYVHSGIVAGQNLNSRVCRNMADPSSTITMDQAPNVAATGKTPSTVGTNHVMRLSMSYPFATQPLDNMMFVTRLNFMAHDDGKKVQNGESGIFIVYAYARCRDGNLSDAECKASILKSGGKSALYYCSDYISSSEEQTMQNAFCGIARLNGVSVVGC